MARQNPKRDSRCILASAKRVSQVEKMINERPVRKFNYQTPNTVFLQKFKVELIA
jgi:IS30 family transposase